MRTEERNCITVEVQTISWTAGKTTQEDHQSNIEHARCYQTVLYQHSCLCFIAILSWYTSPAASINWLIYDQTEETNKTRSGPTKSCYHLECSRSSGEGRGEGRAGREGAELTRRRIQRSDVGSHWWTWGQWWLHCDQREWQLSLRCWSQESILTCRSSYTLAGCP